MSSDYGSEQYRQQQWHAPSDKSINKHRRPSYIHPCQYDADLGSEDSDPESQASETSISQGSYLSSHSPASYNSEETRTEQQQDVKQLLTPESIEDDTWTSTAIASHASPDMPLRRITHDVPFRPKPEAGLNSVVTATSSIGMHQVQNDASQFALSHQPRNQRRGRSVGFTAPPPPLRRDTDGTDTIVRMIVLFCTNLINSIWCTGDQVTSVSSTPQSGANVLPLQIFITETLRRSKTSYSTLQIALYYLILLKQCLPALSAADKSGCRAMQCGRRMFLTSLILASKYLQDRNYSARAWSKISGLPLKEINDNEKRFLGIVCWDLHVPKSTFENWSKIVLQVCRRSLDPDVGCKLGFDPLAKGPGSGPNAQRQCVLQNMTKDMDALRSWWLVNLRQLKTDIVKCGTKTQKYVESIAPFRATPYISRPISPDSDSSDDEKFAEMVFSRDLPLSTAESRQSSLDRSQQSFEPVPDLLHPAAPLSIPPPPTLKNLPTPQTTPQADPSGWWTPRLVHQGSRTSLRCRASASALGSAARRHCPMANLETCPPPMPRPQFQTQQVCPPLDTYLASQASSPESIVSDISSFAPRSRSSSISSTSSWATNFSQNSVKSLLDHSGRLLKDSNVVQHGVQSIACPRQQSVLRQYAPTTVQSIERPRTAFKIVPGSQADFDPVKSWCETTLSADKYPLEGSVNDMQARERQEAAQVLADLYVDESAVRSRARPSLSRSGTQIYDPRQERDCKTQLKRSRSDTFDLSQNSSCPGSDVSTPTFTQPPSTVQHNSVAAYFKTIQGSSQPWAEPRKPLQTGMQNKRLALHLPASSAAAELAGQALKADFPKRASRLGFVGY